MAKARGGMFRQPRRTAKGQGLAAAGGASQNMLRQAQELQQQLAQAQEEIHAATVEVSVGGGVVTVVMSGDRKLRSVTIDPEVVDPKDSEMLQDLVLAAVNEALDKVEALHAERMAGLTGGLPLPGLA